MPDTLSPASNQRAQPHAPTAALKRSQLQMNHSNRETSSGSSPFAMPSLFQPTIPPPRSSRSFGSGFSAARPPLFLQTPPLIPNRAPGLPPPRSAPIIDLTESPPPSPPNNSNPNPNRNRNPNPNPPNLSGARGHEVIDVDALPDAPANLAPPLSLWMNINNEHFDPDGGLEVQFSRDPPRRWNGSTVAPNPGRHPPARPVEPNALYERIEREGFQPHLNNRPEDPILGHGGRIGQGIPDPPEGRPARRLGLPNVMRLITMALPGPRIYEGDGSRAMFQDVPGYFRAPGQLDYRQTAPGIIQDESRGDEFAPARSADYKPPPPAREGFTRSPREGDVLVCADCGWELGVSTESDSKREEVWASKCGHAYCGTCAHSYRILPPSKSTSKRPRAKQKNCVVGCKTNLATKTAMFKIHL